MVKGVVSLVTKVKVWVECFIYEALDVLRCITVEAVIGEEV